MVFTIHATKEFSKDFAKLDPVTQERIRDKLQAVADDPTRYKQLHYDLSGSSRVWIAKLRIIFSYDKARNEVYLEKIIQHHHYRD